MTFVCVSYRGYFYSVTSSLLPCLVKKKETSENKEQTIGPL